MAMKKSGTTGALDFRTMTGAETIAHLASLPPRRRRAVARVLIYKKGKRPKPLADQIVLLDALGAEPALTDFDRAYALIAGGHKVCEQADVEASRHWLGNLLTAEAGIRAMPIGYGLRRDRTHLVFSALNVAMNLDLLTGARHAKRLGDWFFDELDGLNPRRMTPYLFNSNSNVVKCAGLAVLARPETLERTADLMRRLVSYGIEINSPIHWYVLSRFRAPARLAEIEERAAFGSHCNTILRLRAMEDAAAADAGARTEALRRVAELCVAQATREQKAALLDNAERLFVAP